MQGRECGDDVPLPNTQGKGGKLTLLKKGDDKGKDTTVTEHDESSDDDKVSSNDEESKKEATLLKSHRCYRKALAAQRARKRSSGKKTGNQRGGKQKKQRISENRQGKTQNRGRSRQIGSNRKGKGASEDDPCKKLAKKKEQPSERKGKGASEDDPCKKLAKNKEQPSEPIEEKRKQPSAPIVKFVCCEHDEEVSIDDCLLKSCREHNVYLKMPGRYSEYNEKRYLGYQVQDGMCCKRCGVKYKVGSNDGTYMIGTNSSIVMCNSMHLKRECNDIECDHSFCKACWSPLAEQYAKDHDLSGGVGGRTRRSREICIEI